MTGRTFGILSPFVGGDYYGAIIAGINAAAVAGGDRVMAVQTLDPGSHSADRSGLPAFHRPVAWEHLSGMAVLPGAVSAAYAVRARQAGLPVVHVAQDGCGAAVLADNRSGARAAVAHLVAHGHSRIAFAGYLSHYDLRERYEGYRSAMLEHDLTPVLFDSGDNHESGGELVAEELIGAGMPVSAMVAGTDRNAIGLVERLRAAGYELPRDLAVVGFDDIADAAYLRPALSTVRQPLDVLGAAVYRRLSEAAGPAAHAGAAHAGTTHPGISDSGTARPATGHPSPAPSETAHPGATHPDTTHAGATHAETGGAHPGTRHEAMLAEHVDRISTVFVPRESCGCPGHALHVSEEQTRSLFGEVQYLQRTLNIQYELGIALLGHEALDPRELEWLGMTPAVAGCLGLWTAEDEDRLQLAGQYRTEVGAPDAVLAVRGFPPPALFDAADGPGGDIVLIAPVRSRARDWGMLAAVGRIQSTTPPGREMMNHSGSLLGKALDYQVTMAALRRQEEELRTAALRDHLTGLPNRLLLEDRLTQAGLRAARDPSYRFAVLLLDLDGFKAVNDTLGHAAGDQLLIMVAGRLTTLLRRTDTVARLGGDEFVVLVGGVHGADGHETVREAIQSALSEPFLIDDQPVTVGVSIGVAVSGDGAADPDRLLREADAAMYREKTAGRR